MWSCTARCSPVRLLARPVLLTVRTHGLYYYTNSGYLPCARAYGPFSYTMVNYHATDQYRPNVSDQLTIDRACTDDASTVGLLDKDHVWYAVDWLIIFYITVTHFCYGILSVEIFCHCQLWKWSKLSHAIGELRSTWETAVRYICNCLRRPIRWLVLFSVRIPRTERHAGTAKPWLNITRDRIIYYTLISEEIDNY